MKLKVEDFDIVEDEIEIGTINYVGGAVGPGILTVENGFRGSDPDDDNGVDRNGDIDPIPTTGRIAHLRYRVQELRGPDGASIPTSGIQVLGLPRVVHDGERVFGRISVDCPAHLPEGRYSGSLTLWEDNNGDGLISPGELSDSVTLVVTVQDRVDAAIDASIEDMSLIDMAVDAMPDPDISVRLDSDIDMESSDTALDMNRVDVSTIPDTADARSTDDSTIDAVTSDTGRPDTSTDASDMASTDSSAEDTGNADLAVPDASTELDREWPSLPQGGAFHCQAAGQNPLYPLLFCALLLGLRRRR